ncbi:stereocilin [Plakobranchus ocellatus]|uniref:Stereocilin n=1 Tax=Plakobranchus ocellatus TaxID=259542 RepID=A0AAV3ZKX7_9GAST|nr:stereocilin [Plakobranchus ocellatus]
MGDPNFDWTPDKIDLISNFSSAVTPATFNRMNDSTLQHHWEHLKEANLSSSVLVSAWNRMKQSYTLNSLTCNDLHDMGRVIFAMSLKELNKVPSSALLDCVNYIGEILEGVCSEKPAFCSKMWEKIKEEATSVGTPLKDIVTTIDPELLQFVPSEDFEDLSLSDLGGIDNLHNLRLDAAQSEVVMEAIERELGPVSKGNLNYTGQQVEKMGAIFFQGATLESLENLPEGTELMESLPAIMENLEFMNDKKLKVVYHKLQTVLGMDASQSTDVCLDDSTIKQAVGFFTQASGDDMRKLAPDTRKNMLSEIGNNADLVKTMGREGIREHFQVLKETENLDSKSSITADDLSKYGAHIFCGMEEVDVDKLSDDALDLHLADFDECEQLDTQTRKALADKALESSNGLSGLMSDPEKLESMGTLLLNVDLTEAATLPQDKKERLGSMVGTIMEDVNKRVEKREKRSGGDIPTSEKEEEKMLQNEMTRKLWDVVADTIDCQTIQGFHGDLSFLSPSDIDDLDPDVVAECLSEFQKADWDVEQLETFANKIKNKYGNDTGAWDKDVVMQAGKLISGLDTEDIEKLTLDSDIIEVLGQSEIKEPEKMFKKFVADQGIVSMDTLDSDTLRGMGKMVCGMTSDQMRDLQGSVILDVTTDLSSAADCLDEEQLKVIGEKLDTASPPDYWENVNMNEMGMLAAGMSASNIEKLNEDQLSSIAPNAIKLMDEDTFTEAFKPEKLSKLTSDQVTSITPKAMRKMDIGQLIAMENVANGVSDVNATVAAEESKARFKIDIPMNVSVRSLDTFVEVRNLESTTCMSGMAFAGQDDNKLDSSNKRSVFADSLPTDVRDFFERIVSSADHDVSGFTTFELRMVLDFLMNHVDQAGRDTFLDLRTRFSSLPREDINQTVTTWPPQLHLLMKPNLMCSTLGQMDLEVLNNFCKHLTSDEVSTATVIEMLNRCGDCLAAANASRVNDDIIGLITGYKGRVFLDKLQQWKPDDWDIYHLMFAPDSLKPEDIDFISNMDNYRDISQIYRLGDPDFYLKIPKKVMEKLARKLYKALGAPSTWSYLHSNMLLPYIVNMPPKVLKSDLTASMVISIMPNYDLIKDIVNKKFMKIAAWKLSKYLIKNSDSVSADIKEQAICLVLEFSTHKKLWTKVYRERELFNYLNQCASFGVSDTRLSEVIKKIVRAKTFEWNQAAIETLGSLIAAVPKSVLKNVNATLLLDNWEQIKNANFTMPTLRMLWKRFKTIVDLSTADCDLLKLLGRVFLSLNTAEMQTIPDSALNECINYIGPLLEDSCADNKWLCKKVWEKVKAYATGQGVKVGELLKYLGAGFLQVLPKEDIEAIDIDDLGGIEQLSEMGINFNHAPILMRKVSQMKGVVSMNNTNYTAAEIIKMGKVFFHGATGPEYEALPEDPSLFEMLPHMAEFFEDINQKKIEIVFKKLKKILALDTGSNICLDKALAEQIAMFFTAATADDLRKLSTETRKVILQTMGQEYSYVKRMTRQRAQQLFDVMMDLDNLGSKSSYEEEDIVDYGYMWCGQKSAQAAKFSETALDGMMVKLKSCVHLESSTRSTLVSKVISVSGGLGNMLTNTPQRLEDMGSLILDLDTDLVDALDDDQKQVFVSSTKKLMESVTEVQEQATSRPSSEISESEKAQDKSKVASFGRIVFDLHLSVSFSKRRRRRRSLSSADCATIQSFNGALSFLTNSDILSLSTSEFTDCLAEFQTTSWTADQLAAFQTQLINAFGSNTAIWTKTNVVDSGILLDSLTSSHVLSFAVLDDDAVSTLGTYVYSNNAEHLVASFLDSQSITDVSTIDAATLGNMGNLVCGFNSTQMDSLDSAAVDGASSDLASVTCLTSEQLIALANKIVEVQGTDWTSVTSDTVSSLGILAGGLPVSVLEDLGSDQIASISTSAIAAMDPNTFATVFTAAKISEMSSAQANSVTSGQQALLNGDQLAALNEVATTTTAQDDSDNGSTRTNLSTTLAVILTVINLLVTKAWTM